MGWMVASPVSEDHYIIVNKVSDFLEQKVELAIRGTTFFQVQHCGVRETEAFSQKDPPLDERDAEGLRRVVPAARQQLAAV